MSIIRWEAVAEPSDRYPRCHCSALWELNNGDLIVGYYAGEDEARPDAAVVIARRTPGANAFTSLQNIADTPGKPEGNAIFFQNDAGRFICVYGTMHGILEGKAGPGVRWVTCDLRMKHSDDNGSTWSDVEMIEPELGHVPHSKPIRLGSREWLFGTEYKDAHTKMWKSDDDGATWRVIGSVPGEPNQHPTLIRRDDGSILALLRPSGKHPNVLKSVSQDGGKTWSDAEVTDLPCPHAAIDAVKLADGRVVLVWNDNPERRRNPLTVAISEDDGETWSARRNLQWGEGSFHYPAVIQSRSGNLHITFTNNRVTIDHVELTPDWITGSGGDLSLWEGSGSARRWS
ncbi:MAG: exo-alpha-sialidase [Candidatus Poribacteria bacterium]|nr:exo-alpha-sialidase [Candidatus Poribacteria bacterium]